MRAIRHRGCNPDRAGRRTGRAWAAGDSDAPPEGDLAAALDPEADLAAGAAEPDASLGAFLERVALVADSDQIPHAPDETDTGVVTMTLHTAKAWSLTRSSSPVARTASSSSTSDCGAHWERAGGGTAPRVRRYHSGPQAALHLARSPGRPGARPSTIHKPVPERGAQPAGRLAAYGGCSHQLAKHLRDRHPNMA